MNGVLLEVRHIFFEYDNGMRALNNVSLSLDRGEFLGVLGPNGCGKTTLFQTFNGLLRPSGGEILLKGRLLEHWQENEIFKTVGLVFQNPDDQLFAPTVCEDVSYGLVNMNLAADLVEEKVQKALEHLRILDLKNRNIRHLSYGQKRRAAIAGVLAMEPEILVLDEPTAGLDPMGVSELMKLLKEVQKELGISVVLSTHDIDIVPLYCDRVYVMSEGAVILEGTPKKVFFEAELLRKNNLRLPRIAHLMEILKSKDDFEFQEVATTISGARKAIKAVLKRNGKM
jgi:cobalt/nickel transport system ATP-binding protein